MTDGGELHPSGLGYVVDPEAKPKDAYLVDPAACITFPTFELVVHTRSRPGEVDEYRGFSWRPSPADHHDRGEDCGEVECERCNQPEPEVSPAERGVVDLMQALQDSLERAKADRR